MANPELLEILKRGADAWNDWRKQNVRSSYDLTGANLSSAELVAPYYDKSYYAKDRDVTETHIVYIVGADLRGVNLTGADFSDANLGGVNFSNAILNGANFCDSMIWNVDFTKAQLVDTDFTRASLVNSRFTDVDLSESKGLDKVVHHGPSFIGLETLYISGGNIHENFLRGCGVPDDFITFIPSLFGVLQAIQFYSCFISYSTKDEEFARRLYSRIRSEHLRVWFAPEDIKGGQKLHEQIERAIQLHDRLLLVLSENSMRSEWVITEIQRARKTEIEENRRKLFPITIVDFDKVKAWKCFDSDSGKDLAKEVREYFIPDFSRWKDHDAFEAAFERLLRDLKAEEKKD